MSGATTFHGSKRTAVLAGILASILAAGLLLFVVRMPGLPLFLTVIIYTTGIVTANALGIAAAGGSLRLDIEGIPLRTSATVAWIAPLAVYMRAGSIWAIPLAVVVAVKTSRLLAREKSVATRDATISKNETQEMFAVPPPPPKWRLVSLVGAAFCMQSAFATGAAHAVAISSIFTSAAAGIVGWHLSTQSLTCKPANATRDLLASGLTLALAILLTMGGAASGSGEGDGTGKAIAGGSGGAYWGVFLWPETSPKAIKLVAPPSDHTVLDKGLKLRIKIPFDGIYWFYKLPDLRPPTGSVIAYGTPDQVGFRSTDSIPLVMEAHQNLASHVDLTCCSDIEVGLRYGAPDEGIVRLELILMDSLRPFQQPLSLGEVGVGSMESVRFHLPEHPLLTTFDEVTVRFHLESDRETVSPRIAIVDLVMTSR